MLKSCDTMVAPPTTTTDAEMIFAKNSDRPATECQPLVQRDRGVHSAGTVTRCQFVELPEVKTTCRHVGSRPWWCWGYEHGFNEHQVVIGNEGLHSKAEFDSPKLIGMELIRLGLERAGTAAEAVDVMTDLIARYGQGKFVNDQDVRTYDNGYIIADPKEAYILETAGHEWAVKRTRDAVGISNVYSLEDDWDTVSPNAGDWARAQSWWDKGSGKFNFAEAYSGQTDRTAGSGATRRRRSCAMLRAAFGQINVETMISLLSDHGGGAAPDEPLQLEISQGHNICVHHNSDGGGGNTAASLVAHLCADGSRLPIYWCSFYSPCLGVFLPMFIEGETPAVLAVGGEHPSSDSPWRLFRQLSLKARSAAPERIAEIRAEWKPFQTELFESAYEMAKAGKRSIDQGQHHLTQYMAENVERMLHTVRQMLGRLEEVADMAAD